MRWGMGVVIGVLGLALAQPARAAVKLPLLTPAKTARAAEGNKAKVVVRLPAAAKRALTVRFRTVAGTATAGTDFRGRRGKLRFRAGARKATIGVRTVEDTAYEGAERFRVRLSAPAGARLGKRRTTTVTIADDDPPGPLTLSAADVTVAEPADTGAGMSNGLTVSLSGPGAGRSAVSVVYLIEPVDPNVTLDDADRSSGILHFAVGETTKPVPGAVKGDALDEDDEHLRLVLSDPQGATLADSDAVLTITDDAGDLPPTLSIGDAEATETGAGQVPVTLSGPSGRQITINYATTTAGTATTGADFQGTSGNRVIAAGATTASIGVPIIEDSTDEENQTVVVTVSTPVNVTVGDGEATLTITDDDAPPTLSMADIAIAENTTIVQPQIALSAASEKEITVKVSTAGGSATGGALCSGPVDYISLSGLTVTFPPGAAAKTVGISICGDANDEGAAETFNANLTEPVNATIADGSAVVTIADNDP